jgi:hypothetical protein
MARVGFFSFFLFLGQNIKKDNNNPLDLSYPAVNGEKISIN